MGKELYEQSEQARLLFGQANEILGFRITDIMFEGTDEDLRQTRVTQPAIFLHSVILAKVLGNEFEPDMVGGIRWASFRRWLPQELYRSMTVCDWWLPAPMRCKKHARYSHRLWQLFWGLTILRWKIFASA
jgi:hypothetical protein